MHRRTFTTLAATSALCTPAIASTEYAYNYDLDFWLCLDSSSSMRNDAHGVTHWYIQNQGHIAALLDEEVQHTLLAQRTYLRIVSWHDTMETHITHFAGPVRESGDLYQASEMIRWAREPKTKTATFHDKILKRVYETPQLGWNRVVDISTDEVVRYDRADFVTDYRQRLERMGTSVNVLAVDMTEEEAALLATEVQTQLPWSFTHEVGWQPDEYRLGIKRKILTEASV